MLTSVTLRVGTWNLENLVSARRRRPTELARAYAAKLGQLAAVITAQAPDGG